MIKAFLITLVKAYQLSLSAVLGNRCRFYPSCSQYTIEAIERHGSVKGIVLGFKRLARCHPLCDGGVDLVPENHENKHKA